MVVSDEVDGAASSSDPTSIISAPAAMLVRDSHSFRHRGCIPVEHERCDGQSSPRVVPGREAVVMLRSFESPASLRIALMRLLLPAFYGQPSTTSAVTALLFKRVTLQGKTTPRATALAYCSTETHTFLEGAALNLLLSNLDGELVLMLSTCV